MRARDLACMWSGIGAGRAVFAKAEGHRGAAFAVIQHPKPRSYDRRTLLRGIGATPDEAIADFREHLDDSEARATVERGHEPGGYQLVAVRPHVHAIAREFANSLTYGGHGMVRVGHAWIDDERMPKFPDMGISGWRSLIPVYDFLRHPHTGAPPKELPEHAVELHEI